MAGGLRARIEARFEGWGRFVARRPLSVAVASLLLVALCMAGLPRVRADVTFEAFLREGDPILLAQQAFQQQFGRDERAIISASPGVAAGPLGVFDLAFLEKLRNLHEAIENEVPYLDDVTSLVNARDTRAEGDTLVVGDFLDPWPSSEAELDALRARAIDDPLFRGSVIATDASEATLVLDIQLFSSLGEEDALAGFDEPLADAAATPLLTGEENAELVRVLQRVVAAHRAPDFELHLAGTPVIIQSVAASMQSEMPRFVGLAIASIALLLFLLFRRVSAVVIPLVIVVLSLGSTIGMMGWTDTPLHVPTQVLPTFLLAVGVGDAVHLLSIFFQRLRRGDPRDEALAHALGHSGLAIVLTSLTTAGGLGSFSTAGVAPIAAIGVFAPFGVMMALLLSMTLLPAVLVLVPLGSTRAVASTPSSFVDRLLFAFARFSTRHPRSIVAGTAALAAVALAGAAQLGLSYDPLGWLNPELEVVRGTKHIDRALGGSISFEVLLDTEREGGVRQPEVLQALAAAGESLESEPRGGESSSHTVSLADVVKEIHRALNEDRAEAYRIPDDPRLVAQELLLFENSGSDDLEEVADTRYALARLSVRMPWRDAVHYTEFFEQASSDLASRLGPHGSVEQTGMLSLMVRALPMLAQSMVDSYLIAFAVIAPLMILLLGSVRIGLLAMIPNLLPILLALGLMGWADLPLDAFSLLLGGIALGLAVDDTIHFMHNYRRYRGAGASLEEAVHETLQTAGRAMLITTVVLSMGFFGFVLSSMNNLTNMGLLVSFAITMAFLADVLLAPALMALVDPDR